ncbi:2750_t:CDS:2 [Ambispora gerdemannii]|uniref:2750_t:CDS:1 n=1 Tax=Ambispora gerdemannii TaxID=144530 RepID=A0A9N9B891_9GLOM|nr:2750_t:CDS:2 [Ambispora gerdemannii]
MSNTILLDAKENYNVYNNHDSNSNNILTRDAQAHLKYIFEEYILRPESERQQRMAVEMMREYLHVWQKKVDEENKNVKNANVDYNGLFARGPFKQKIRDHGELISIQVGLPEIVNEQSILGDIQFVQYWIQAEVWFKNSNKSITVRGKARYNDFVDFRDRLVREFETEIPVLPAKKIFGRFDNDFLQSRSDQLNEWLSELIVNFGRIDQVLDWISRGVLGLTELDVVRRKEKPKKRKKDNCTKSTNQKNLRGIEKVASRHLNEKFENDDGSPRTYKNNSNATCNRNKKGYLSSLPQHLPPIIRKTMNVNCI